MDGSTSQVGVTFALEPAEVAGVEWAAPRIVGPRRFVVLHDVAAETWELELTFDGDLDVGAAETLGVETYRAIRVEAMLPDREPVPLTGVTPMRVGPADPSYDWIADAEEFNNQKHFEYAVVAAHVACELEIAQTVETLSERDMNGLGAVLSAVVRPSALQRDKGSQALFAAAGYPVAEQTWWRDYQTHVQRRYNVIHRGAKLSATDAAASVEVMWRMVESMRHARRAPG